MLDLNLWIQIDSVEPPHTSLDCEPRRLRVRFRSTCGLARMNCARVQRALGVCAVVHVMTHSFSERGDDAHPSPLAERRDGHTPTLRVDTHPPQECPTYTVSVAPLPPTFRVRRPAEDPGAPLLCAVRVSPSSQHPPGSGAAKSNKNSEATRQVENYWRQMPELQTANLTTLRALRNTKNSVKRPKSESMRKSTKSSSNQKQEPNRDRRTEERRKNSSKAKTTSTTKNRRTERTSTSPTCDREE